jgi:protein-S-isoprenylcysteine O-methyltransferase Ste14
LFSKLILATVIQTAVFVALLFVPAGTLDWWRAWVFVAVMLVGSLASSIGILNVNQELFAERLKPPIQKGQSLADKILLPAMVTAFVGVIVFIPLDVFRFHLLAKPNAIVSSLGLVLFVIGWWIAYLGMRENAFAAPVIKYQEGREHAVVDTGPYRLVRHPMYAGGILVFIGAPLWLESTAAALLALVPIVLVLLRVLVEENFLRRELPGYAAYAQRVRYRLIPFLW